MTRLLQERRETASRRQVSSSLTAVSSWPIASVEEKIFKVCLL